MAWRALVDAARAELDPAIVARVDEYKPYFADRKLTKQQFEDAAPHLRDVALLALPASVDLAADYMGWGVGLLEHLLTKRMPRKAHLLWRDTTRAGYLATRKPGSKNAGQAILGRLHDAAHAALAGKPLDVEERAERTAAQRAQAVADVQQAQRDGERTDGPLLADATKVRDADSAERAALGLVGEHVDELLVALAAVRVMVQAARPDALLPQPGKVGRGKSIPVGHHEVVQLLRTAATARSAKDQLYRRGATLVGLGGGLAGEALAGVRGTDIGEHVIAGRPLVTVAVTRRGVRVLVPVLPPLAPAVRRIGEQAGGAYVVGGGTARTSRLSVIARQMRDADGRTVSYDSFRLRATWLVLHVMAGSYLPAVLACAGLDGLSTVEELLPYCPPLPTLTADPLAAALREQMLAAAVLAAEAAAARAAS